MYVLKQKEVFQEVYISVVKQKTLFLLSLTTKL
jgi:hypothetical protein